jgi:hypothetical protein
VFSLRRWLWRVFLLNFRAKQPMLAIIYVLSERFSRGIVEVQRLSSFRGC